MSFVLMYLLGRVLTDVGDKPFGTGIERAAIALGIARLAIGVLYSLGAKEA